MPVIRLVIRTPILYQRTFNYYGHRFSSTSSGPEKGSKHAESTPTEKLQRTESLASKDGSSKPPSDSGSSSSSLFSGSSPEWEDQPNWDIEKFSQLPFAQFGYNQHMKINEDFKESLRLLLWQFRAPIRYAFAYGSGVFSQSSASSPSPSSLSPHPHPSEAIVKWQKGGGKVIDFIFGVSHTQHWHAVNMQQYPEHYSFLGKLGSGLVSRVQDNWGAGVYFNPYITINGTMIKYGVVNLDTLQRDLSQWDTLYLAGRLQKPVKILRDDPKVRLANQVNLISALRTALLMLGPKFSEIELYTKIAGLSYMGDPRMQFKGEDPNKVRNIVTNQLPNFRQLYGPLVQELPNVSFNDIRCHEKDWVLDTDCNCAMAQDMDPKKRGNMVRRLPSAFRGKLYMEYRKKWQIPGAEYQRMLEENKDEDEAGFKRREGGQFDQRIANEGDLKEAAGRAIRQTVSWPSWSQSIKSFATAGITRSLKYMGEKRSKGQQARIKKEVKGAEKNSQG